MYRIIKNKLSFSDFIFEPSSGFIVNTANWLYFMLNNHEKLKECFDITLNSAYGESVISITDSELYNAQVCITHPNVKSTFGVSKTFNKNYNESHVCIVDTLLCIKIGTLFGKDILISDGVPTNRIHVIEE